MPEATIDLRARLASDAALSVAAADDVFRDISDALRSGQRVTVDFAGVRNATTVFLNTAIGQLYGSFAPESVDANVQFRNASALVASMLQMTIKNARLFYSEGHTVVSDGNVDEDDGPCR